MNPVTKSDRRDSGVDTSSRPESEQVSDVELVVSWSSPMAHQVAITFRHKGIKFTIVEENALNWNPKTLHFSPLFKMIPILIHRGKLISDPLIIVEYVEESWPKSVQLLPSDPFGRSSVRYWSHYVQNQVVRTVLRFAMAGAEHLNQILFETFEGLNKTLCLTCPEGCFFMGDELGLVDIVFAPIIPWVQALQRSNLLKFPSSRDCPRLHRWIDALEQHPRVKPTLQICSPEKLKTFIGQTLNCPHNDNLSL